MNRHLAVEILSSYMDEEITPAQLRLVEDHLGDCTECRRTLAGLRAVAANVGRLEAVAPPATLSAAVERRVRFAIADESRGFRLEDGLRRWLGQPVLAPAFATVLALAAILYLFAFGVSKGGRHNTRVLVASAPSEEGKESSMKTRDSAADQEVRASESVAPMVPAGPVGKTDLDSLGAVREPQATGEDVPARPRLDGRTQLAEKLRSIEGDAKVEESVVADAAVLNEQDEKERIGPRTEALMRTPPTAKAARAMADESSTDNMPVIRVIEGRRFFEDAEVWVEVGLEGQAVSELIDLRLDEALLSAELAAFQDLERVRLRIDGRLVEVIFQTAEDRD
jgi:hypothetical protein